MSTTKSVRRNIMRFAKILGLFALSRRLTRGHLRILCYHGSALDDESGFRPGLFMTAETFAERLRYLASREYPVVTLDKALTLWRQGALPENATVITIDDGWYGTYRVMAPLLAKYGFPATLYVASYYMEKQTQVFNVAVDYALWRSRGRRLELSDIDPSLDGEYDLSIADQRAAAASAIIGLGESRGEATERQSVFLDLCDALGLDGHEIVRRRLISYMSKEEASELAEAGIDVQLHSHRHRFPEQFELAREEIEENRSALDGGSGRPLVHFCYPSGEYTKQQIPWLQSLGIASATTTELGINGPEQSPYELKRIVDSESMSAVEFEAELCGFSHLLRRAAHVQRRNDER